MNPDFASFLSVLRNPSRMPQLSEAAWDLLLRQAAQSGLLGRLGALAQQEGLTERLPKCVQHSMQSALTVAKQQHRAVLWELVQLTKTFSQLKGPVILLKGAAYTAANLAPSHGRLFSDIDILVPKAELDAAEAALMLDGWNSRHHDAYEQRYYRQWMHELPPMSHIRRQTILDLHHNILPETARIQTRPDLIVANATPLDEYGRFSIPSATDQILHSATHLFHEGEWGHGLRDLMDLDALLRSHTHEPDFWAQLLGRAAELGLGKPLFYGLRYCNMLLETPVPQAVMQACPHRPGRVATWTMDRLFLPAFATAHYSCRHWSSGFAEFCLYVRSHWLRMPLHLLIPHLVRKSWDRRVASLFEKKSDSDKEPALP